MRMKGIDISHWQGSVDFKAIADKTDKDFVIIKAGGSDNGFYKDPKFEVYYNQINYYGLAAGAYYFVGRNFYGKESGVVDAKRFHNIIKGKRWGMPVYLDIETTDPARRKEATDAAIAFCDYLEKKGYYAGIYASEKSGFHERLELDRLDKYDKWVARYGRNVETVKCGMHQYSSTGAVTGIKGKVDLDYAFKNYPYIISHNHLNGF